MTVAGILALIVVSFYSGVPVKFIALVAVSGLTVTMLCAACLQLFVSWRKKNNSPDNILREHQGDVLHVNSR